LSGRREGGELRRHLPWGGEGQCARWGGKKKKKGAGFLKLWGGGELSSIVITDKKKKKRKGGRNRKGKKAPLAKLAEPEKGKRKKNVLWAQRGKNDRRKSPGSPAPTKREGEKKGETEGISCNGFQKKKRGEKGGEELSPGGKKNQAPDR